MIRLGWAVLFIAVVLAFNAVVDLTTFLVERGETEQLRKDIAVLEDEAAMRDEVINQLMFEIKESR